ncbi:hypothetical protein H0H92_015804 [Tricholoma furcatifolium]|nr:hypothetical protein H0H92_015804 [Tricholoma furcatifolium]
MYSILAVALPALISLLAVNYCLGGCSPLGSHSMDSCKPSPICESKNMTFSNFDRVLQNASYYNGNASEWDWIMESGNILQTNITGGAMTLTLTEANQGTLLSSTRYVHYGKITTRLKTSRWGGVVTAFIMMSDVRDEIDWEFPGNKTLEGQTNYFWQGYVPTGQNNGGVSNISTDSYENFHDYTFDWQPTYLAWGIDGQIVRTVHQNETVDKEGVYHFPNTPARIQLSIWPAGIASSAAGTVIWGGGMIDWQDPDYLSAGYFDVVVQSVSVDCTVSNVRTATEVTAYTYGNSNASLLTPDVMLVNASTILGNGAESILGLTYSLRATLAIITGLLTVALAL